MAILIDGTVLAPGHAEGVALVSGEPLSFWGGYDAATGKIIDQAHPLSGERAAGRVLVLPFSRGSSTGTAVLLEAIRRGTAPAAIVVGGRDIFFPLAAIVAQQLYGRSVPVVAIPIASIEDIQTGDRLVIGDDGHIRSER
jgi:predicted aconitase with swiveling domain